MDVLRALDKRDRLGDLGVFDLLTTGRVDDSGAKTDGCGLSLLQACKLMMFLNVQHNPRRARRVAMVVILAASPCDDHGNGWLRLLEMVRQDGLDLEHCLDQLADREIARGNDPVTTACHIREGAQ